MNPYPEAYRNAIPPLLTALIVLWALVGRLLTEGAAVFYYPLLLLYPVILLSHGWLIWRSESLKRLDQAFYGLVHGILAFVVWTFAIMYLRNSSVL